jgi:hypothetical protein
MEFKKYFPYVSSDRPSKKFYIITNDNKKIYFGQSGYEHFTEGHLDERRKWAYIITSSDEVKIGVIQILPVFGLFIICGFILHTNRQ